MAKQLNGKLSDSKLVRRQQQIPLFIGPIALFVLVLVFDAAVGTMIFLMASDLFNLRDPNHLAFATTDHSGRPSVHREVEGEFADAIAISRAVNPRAPPAEDMQESLIMPFCVHREDLSGHVQLDVA